MKSKTDRELRKQEQNNIDGVYVWQEFGPEPDQIFVTHKAQEENNSSSERINKNKNTNVPLVSRPSCIMWAMLFHISVCI